MAFAQDLFGIKILRHSEYKPLYLYPCIKLCTYCMQIRIHTCTYACIYLHIYMCIEMILLNIAVSDEQGFKDISGVYYRFTPDDGQDGESTSKAKIDFSFRNSFACANIEVSKVHVCILQPMTHDP